MPDSSYKYIRMLDGVITKIPSDWDGEKIYNFILLYNKSKNLGNEVPKASFVTTPVEVTAKAPTPEEYTPLPEEQALRISRSLPQAPSIREGNVEVPSMQFREERPSSFLGRAALIPAEMAAGGLQQLFQGYETTREKPLTGASQMGLGLAQMGFSAFPSPGTMALNYALGSIPHAPKDIQEISSQILSPFGEPQKEESDVSQALKTVGNLGMQSLLFGIAHSLGQKALPQFLKGEEYAIQKQGADEGGVRRLFREKDEEKSQTMGTGDTEHQEIARAREGEKEATTPIRTGTEGAVEIPKWKQPSKELIEKGAKSVSSQIEDFVKTAKPEQIESIRQRAERNTELLNKVRDIYKNKKQPQQVKQMLSDVASDISFDKEAVREYEKVRGASPTETTGNKPSLTPAYRRENGEIVTGNNHPEILKKLNEQFKTKEERTIDKNFGFVNEKGEFLTRSEAEKYGKQHNLIIPGVEENRPEYQQGQLHSDELKEGAKDPRLIGLRQESLSRLSGGKIKPGSTYSPEQTLQRGEQLIKQGNDPYKIINNFESGRGLGMSSGDAIAVLRKKNYDLWKEAFDLSDRAEKEPNNIELQNAAQRANDIAKEFDRRQKPISTDLSQGMKNLQGENDIDTGDYHSVLKKLQENTNKTISSLRDEAIRISSSVRSSQNKVINQGNAIIQEIKKLQENNIISPEDAQIISYAKKNYIDNGTYSLEETIQNTASDLSIPRSRVTEALSNQKPLKKMIDTMYQLQSERRRAIAKAKADIELSKLKGLAKAYQFLFHSIYSTKVVGHTVGMETHAGQMTFHPTSWNNWGKGWKNQFYSAGSDIYHEKMLQDIEDHPRYKEWTRSRLGANVNLAVDPYQAYSEWLSDKASKIPLVGKLAKAGSKSMDALKALRLSEAERLWAKVPISEKTPDRMKVIAEIVNAETGYHSVVDKIPFVPIRTRDLFFAAPLESSRWYRIGAPFRAASIEARVLWDKVFNNNNVTPDEKYFANHVLKRTAEFTAIYGSSLVANQYLNKLLGSEEKINFTDPSKSDWLAHKIGNKQVALEGRVLAPLRLAARILYYAFDTKVRGQERANRIFTSLGWYVRGKLSPFYGNVVDMTLSHDFTGRPLPWSTDVGTVNKPKYTWKEYLATNYTPIPVEGAIQEFTAQLHNADLSDAEIRDYINALTVFGSESIGIPMKEAQHQATRQVRVKTLPPIIKMK